MSSKALIAAACAVLALAAAPAQAIDWGKVKGKDITLFYPAQMSWEMVLTQAEHSGAGKFREGKDCRGCHEGEEKASGNLLVNDTSVEATPIKDKPGSVVMTVKTARDADRLYVQVAFNPGTQPDAGMDKEFPTKVAVMIDDGKVAEAARAGCWAACHDNLTRMPSAAEGKETTKYLVRSRAAVSRKGGEEIKPAADIDKMRAEGAFLEYWQARLKPGAPAVAADGTILEKRIERATPLVAAEASEAGGMWTVTFSRPLNAGDLSKPFAPGKTYTVGFSVHAGHAAQRFHYVSLEKTLVLDSGKADFVAAQQ